MHCNTPTFINGKEVLFVDLFNHVHIILPFANISQYSNNNKMSSEIFISFFIGAFDYICCGINNSIYKIIVIAYV